MSIDINKVLVPEGLSEKEADAYVAGYRAAIKAASGYEEETGGEE